MKYFLLMVLIFTLVTGCAISEAPVEVPDSPRPTADLNGIPVPATVAPTHLTAVKNESFSLPVGGKLLVSTGMKIIFDQAVDIRAETAGDGLLITSCDPIDKGTELVSGGAGGGKDTSCHSIDSGEGYIFIWAQKEPVTGHVE